MLTIPDQFAPVNTDGLWFQMNSASYSQSDFKYVVDVYSTKDFTTTYTVGTVSLGRFKIPPRPVTGDGIFTPHQILKTQISNAPLLPISATGINQTIGSMVKYWIDYGFELDPEMPYYDFVFHGGTFSIQFLTPHDLNVGDVILVDKTNQKVNTSYNGYQTVLQVLDPYYVATDAVYTGVNTPPGGDGGYITNILRLNGTTNANGYSSTGGNYTWNAIRQYDEKGVNFGTRYVVRNDTQTFLTGYTSSMTYMKPVRVDQYETLGFLGNPNSVTGVFDSFQYLSYDTNNNLIDSITFSLSSPPNYKGKFEVGIGPMNIIDLLGVSFTNVDHYQIRIRQGSFTRTHVWRRIDRTCTPYEIIQLTWLNRQGSYEYYSFIRRQTETLTTQRMEWKKQLSWDYTVGDRQQSVLSQKSEKTYVLNSDNINEYDYEFLNELITSPEVYKIVDTTRIPIVITDSKWVQKKQYPDQIFNLTINYKDAQNFMTQDN